jgi:hypothetical protein
VNSRTRKKYCRQHNRGRAELLAPRQRSTMRWALVPVVAFGFC